jgi:hypothetical protein
MADLILNSIQFHAFQYQHPNGASEEMIRIVVDPLT